jgi:hypothetical protein
MWPSCWFAVGSADGSELGVRARAAGEALVRDGMRGFPNQIMVVLSIA